MEPYPGWLDDLRSLLIFGWLVLAGWWFITVLTERPDKPKAPPQARPAYCPLHRKLRDQCQDMHE